MEDVVVYRWLALVVVVLHFAYLGYLVIGGFLAWRWPRTVALHLVAAFWGALIVATEAPCPLTWVQNVLRTAGGHQELPGGFIDGYVTGVLYPAEHETPARIAVAVLVAVSWSGLTVRRGPLLTTEPVPDNRAVR